MKNYKQTDRFPPYLILPATVINQSDYPYHSYHPNQLYQSSQSIPLIMFHLQPEPINQQRALFHERILVLFHKLFM